MDVSTVAFQPVSSGADTASGSSAVVGQKSDGMQGAAHSVSAAVKQVSQNTDSKNTDTKPAVSSPTPSPEKLAQTINHVNETFSQRGQNLYASFEKDQATGISVVKIVDKSTKEIISQIPSKEMVGFAQFLDQSQGKGGQLVNIRA
jgi:flagellar protein FlaG